MNQSKPSFTINVDPANPGQFFACCGLLELADRLWPGVEGWFSDQSTSFSVACEGSLLDVLVAMKSIELLNLELGEDNAENDELDDDESFKPIVLKSPCDLILDWWQQTSLKPWAGSMNATKIIIAMARAIDSENRDPWNDAKIVCDPESESSTIAGRSRIVNGKPREPCYFGIRSLGFSRYAGETTEGYCIDHTCLRRTTFNTISRVRATRELCIV